MLRKLPSSLSFWEENLASIYSSIKSRQMALDHTKNSFSFGSIVLKFKAVAVTWCAISKFSAKDWSAKPVVEDRAKESENYKEFTSESPLPLKS